MSLAWDKAGLPGQQRRKTQKRPWELGSHPARTQSPQAGELGVGGMSGAWLAVGRCP